MYITMCLYITNYYPALGVLKISFYKALYHRHYIITIQFSPMYVCIYVCAISDSANGIIKQL